MYTLNIRIEQYEMLIGEESIVLGDRVQAVQLIANYELYYKRLAAIFGKSFMPKIKTSITRL